ncbi:DUF2325 domain-containing protein [Nitrosomonas sp.]|uniref:DUF2325 domain-containing protein n=1 Tax=Nitrosomonas sp. TaxID=42353 RepID=UPI001D3BBA98|nr:DUF2325 domain-containing protein [Nitrosomonas sp.]MBX3616524.1 DUF2325 domain-containing protein [Nitrosomonas sp.]
MKFINKSVIAASLCTAPHYHASNSTHANSFLSYRLGSVTRLFTLLKQWYDGLGQVLITNIDDDSSAHKTSAFTGWAPLIKASSKINTAIAGNSNDVWDHYCDTAHLKNRSVLCVGGRIKLYSYYERLVATCGGHFLAFHGDANDSLDRLPLLLEMADMIICPVDCVNHEAFLMVKRFCRYTQKPCVLLDRSEIKTFNAGIQALSTIRHEIGNQPDR